jgi:hypothetical protein
MKAHVGGPLILTKFIEDMDNYTVVEAKKFRKRRLISLWQICIWITQTKQNINTQISLKNNQYPKAVTKAATILSNHRWDQHK